jgi:signal transduction histidine kinase
LNGDIITTLYRVARESLANVAEHAQAHKVGITLGCDPADGTTGTATVLLRIIDDGTGIDPNQMDIPNVGHFGLRLLRDRVENLDGTLTVRPGAHSGTIVLAELPVNPQSNANSHSEPKHRHPARKSKKP